MTNIHNLQKKLKKLQKEIEHYQENCEHRKQQIRFDDKQSAHWFCIKCDKKLRLPSQSELQDWLKK